MRKASPSWVLQLFRYAGVQVLGTVLSIGQDVALQGVGKTHKISLKTPI